MYDYGLSTLEQYSLTVLSTARTRGALLCRCEEGLFILKEFKGTEKKLGKQQELLEGLSDAGCRVDRYLPNKEGNLVSRDRDNIPYTLQFCAIPDRRRISCGACGLWHRCINI